MMVGNIQFIEKIVAPVVRTFGELRPLAEFYPNITSGKSHYGKCFKLPERCRIVPTLPMLPFFATAISERGIFVCIEDDELISFGRPGFAADEKDPFHEVELDQETEERNLPRETGIISIDGPYFFERKGKRISHYDKATGQLVI